MVDKVYITNLGKFLPNAPVTNDGMEEILGKINGMPSRGRRIVLRNNGIRTRYYAVDGDGEVTHSNAEMTANAVRQLLGPSFSLDDLELLCCGTSIPDQFLPSHASMVQGALGGKNMEVTSMAGVCCSGMHAMKYGMLSIMTGNTSNAVCTGSELASPLLLARHFETEMTSLGRLKTRPVLAFEKDFLRWMLSDGAGAALLQAQPNSDHALSLRIDWIDTYSFAGEVATCMYAGADRDDKGNLVSWKTLPSEAWLEKSIFAIKQDVDLLDRYVIKLGTQGLAASLHRHGIPSSQIDYLLPHLSSEYFRAPLDEEMKALGIPIPQDKWYTNLSRVGNVGSASIYLMLEELFHLGRLDRGMTILALVPESARFAYAYMLLTVC
ncbi:MAG: 3-oxoacyl-[acyl-carrier-protein] synthase [Thermodesulfobacteriota bacterium]|nr:3-oxoacyl-[acyl-carrier-protein] synthase [Thermodesulfobacteriota bacterium]